ncbi:MAG: 4Fe-4S binding protein [Anaerolineales bacterium]|jgi:NADH-quinone oxidoreductase subunit I|nr:4Fe-4S binding protein [Anaerolineales bacterium]
MYGRGLLKGLGVTLKHFVETYLDDIRWLGKHRYHTEEGISHRSSVNTSGIFTIQYPEERLIIPEEFRFIPILIYEEDENGDKRDRCTSCGICSKVCPPQCIWIVRTNDPKTGRPIPEPEEFYIDVDICMNCGLCAEYCPFDAIKMDHDFELALYDRSEKNIYNKERLSRPVSYYSMIRPNNYNKEETARVEAAAAKDARKAARQQKTKASEV